MARPLILCCGHPDGGDDALGPRVAALLRRAGVPAVTLRSPLALIDYWQGDAHVIVVDAVMSGQRPPGTRFRWEGGTPPAELSHTRCSTHGLGLAHTLRLAELLGRMPGRLTVCGVEIASAVPGAPLTPAVAAAARELAHELELEWRQEHQPVPTNASG
jgi:hydrogenase maturation protease